MEPSFSIWHLIVAAFWVAILLAPGRRIASKGRVHGAWSLLLVPVLNVLVIWMFAFIKWPNGRAA